MMFSDTRSALEDESGSDWDDLKAPSPVGSSSKRTNQNLKPLSTAHARNFPPEPPKDRGASQSKRRGRQHKQYDGEPEQEGYRPEFGHQNARTRTERDLQPPFDFSGAITPNPDTQTEKIGRAVKRPYVRQSPSPQRTSNSWDSDLNEEERRKLSDTRERAMETAVLKDSGREEAGGRGTLLVEEREEERRKTMPFSHAVERPTTVSSVRLLQQTIIGEEGNEEERDEMQEGKRKYERQFPLLHYQQDSSNYFSSRDDSEAIMMSVADKSERCIRRLWQEVFGLLRLVSDFIVVFLIELLRFLLQTVFHRCMAAAANLVSNHCVQPILSAIHNIVFQPLAVLLWFAGQAISRLLNPILDILKRLSHIVAEPLRAFRLVEISQWKAPTVEHV